MICEAHRYEPAPNHRTHYQRNAMQVTSYQLGKCYVAHQYSSYCPLDMKLLIMSGDFLFTVGL